MTIIFGMMINRIYGTLCSGCRNVRHNLEGLRLTVGDLQKNQLRFVTKEPVVFVNSEESDKPDKLSPVEKLLNNASPLKSNLFQEHSAWLTSAYPQGTVFKKEISAQEIKEMEPLRPITDPGDTSIILFPGQGSQYVGMGRNLLDYPVVMDMFASASDILGYNLLKLCLEGPAEKLNKTEYCQPAVVVCSLAAIEKLKVKRPDAINSCVATAGFSVGEISALVFGGAIPFERAIQLIKVRAEAMKICSDVIQGGMLSVLYGAGTNFTMAINDAKKYCLHRGIADPVCCVANYLTPYCKVIAGNEAALKYIEENTRKYNIRKTFRLPVSGAFHSPLMEPAVTPFYEALKRVDIRDPIINIMSNVTGRKYRNPSHILKVLPRQISAPVKWEQIMHELYEREEGLNFPDTFECGPGKSLSTILGKVNAKAGKYCRNIQT